MHIVHSSKNLKEWTKESEFGQKAGAHGGVWECPDLFSLDFGGKKIWVLLVSINPGGPNGGSATQYFTGRFDGQKFTPDGTEARWIDYGPDDYAGIPLHLFIIRKVFFTLAGRLRQALCHLYLFSKLPFPIT
jgi:fructan beta-fructosidase